MRKLLLLSTFALLLAFGSSLLAQTTSMGDTLLIGPLNSQGQPIGALNEAIRGDTTATGERQHKVYKLERGTQYILTEVIDADFHLIIVADEPDDDNRPPIIRTGLNEAGETVGRWWRIFDHATFKNLWLSGINLEGTGPIDWISQEVITENKTIRYEGCIIEFPYTWWAVFADWGSMNSYHMTDCIFMNIGNPTGVIWNGAIFHEALVDSVVIRNSTFYNFGCFALHTGSGTYYAEVDHCTFVNSVVHPMNNHRGVKQILTNNLFVNTHAFSDDFEEIKRHFDQEVKGIINYAEIQWDPVRLDSLWGPSGEYGKSYDPNGDGVLTPDELVFELRNNAWWYTKPIKDYWDQFDEVVPNPWMNNYNRAMFENKDEEWEWEIMTYEFDDDNNIIDSAQVTMTHQPFQFFIEENTMNVDPGLININNTDELLAQNSINIRMEWAGHDIPAEDVVRFHGIDDYLAFTWPLDFNLAYTNPELLTASTRGGPVGSLQWFPDWEEPTNVPEFDVAEKTFGLLMNYPNPFSNTTTIDYVVNRESKINIDVYNSLGVRVASLVNEIKLPGDYSVTFDGTNLSNGFYFLHMKSGNQISTSKMILLK